MDLYHTITIKDAAALQPILKELKETKTLVLDTETNGLNWQIHRPFLMPCSTRKNKYAVHLDQSELCQRVMHEFLNEVFSNTDYSVIGHNIKFDLHMLSCYGPFPLQAQVNDTMYLSVLLDSTRESHKLKDLAREHLGIETREEEAILSWFQSKKIPKGERDYSLVPKEIMLPYAVEDVTLTDKLFTKFYAAVGEAGMEALYKVEMNVLKSVFTMEQKGVKLDIAAAQQLYNKYVKEEDEVRKVANAACGNTKLNLNSPQQLAEFFASKGYTDIVYYVEQDEQKVHVNDAALREINTDFAHAVLAYREAVKKKNCVEGLLDAAKWDGRVHADFLPWLARTGRWSCRNPNLQNIPKVDEIRALLVADDNTAQYYFDQAQIEMVGLALYSQDKTLCDAITNGDDLHAITAAKIFNIPLEQVDKNKRRGGKGANFSIIYGVGKKRFGSYLRSPAIGMETTDEEAKKILDSYFVNYPAIVRLKKNVQDAAQVERDKFGYHVRNKFGRRVKLSYRVLSDEDYADYLKHIALRRANSDYVLPVEFRGVYRRNSQGQHCLVASYKAANYLLQGWAADLMKCTISKLWEAGIPISLCIHDEIRVDFLQGPGHNEGDFVRKICRIMTEWPEIPLPIRVSIARSTTSWADARKVEAPLMLEGQV